MTDTDSTTGPSGAASAAAQPRGFGIDVGGSGIKGGIVDLDTGQLIGDRYKLPTPQPATPAEVAKTIAAVVNEFGWTGPLGVTYPGVVTEGVAQTAANVDRSWIGVNANEVIADELDGQDAVVLNDADAAGLAEVRYGAGKDHTGVIVLLTFGTGIGSAIIHNGKLLPNTELGHLEVHGKEAEHRAASSVRDRHDWSYKKWTKQVTKVLVTIEDLFCPDLFIAGGGISRKADKWVPLLENRT
ncbi:MAG: polyphosphate--glucose phosphotransferase, partial [Mycobacterium sp.]